MSEKKQPKKTFRCGSVKATLWENKQNKDGKEFTLESVSLTNSYKDKDGNWKTSNNYKKGDLHKLITVAQKMYEFLGVKEDFDKE